MSDERRKSLDLSSPPPAPIKRSLSSDALSSVHAPVPGPRPAPQDALALSAPLRPPVVPVSSPTDVPRPAFAAPSGVVQPSSQLSAIIPVSPRRDPALAFPVPSINASADERSSLLQGQADAPRWSNAQVNRASLAAQAADAIGAGLSLSAALATPNSVPAVAQNLASGASWGVSGLIGAAAGRATNAAWAAGAGVFNAIAGASSVTATGLGTADSSSWTSTYAAPAASYISNAAWAAAGVSAVGDGISTIRRARNWSATFAGSAQIVSGAANVVAGAASAASTYLHSQDATDPRATAASVVSGAAWVTGSAFGALSAGLSWYSRSGSGNAAASDNAAHRDLNV